MVEIGGIIRKTGGITDKTGGIKAILGGINTISGGIYVLGIEMLHPNRAYFVFHRKLWYNSSS